MPDSVVNVSAASSIAFPVPTVYFAPAGALEVSGRILSGESRSETSQARVGCGLQGRPPAGIVHEARESAQGTSACFHLPEPRLLVGVWSRLAPLFSKKGLSNPHAGLESGKLKKIIFLLPTCFLFHARFRFERRNPRLERRCLDPFVTGVPP